MRTVARYAAPAPDSSTPSSHAWGVSNGSRPMVRSNAHAAATEITNCRLCTAATIAKYEGADYGP